MIRLIGFIVLLGPTIWLDIKERKIPVIFCLVYSVTAATLNMIFSWLPLWEEIAALAFSGLFFLASIASKESIGLGDGWLILAGSLWCGFLGALEITFAGLTTAGLFGVCYILICKKGWKTRLPFAPFYGLAAITWAAVTWIMASIGGGG